MSIRVRGVIAGMMLGAGAVPCAAGPSAIPIGPEGDYSYQAFALNNQRDALFQVWAVSETDFVDGDQTLQAELIRATGECIRINDPGWDEVDPRALGPGGEMVVGLARSEEMGQDVEIQFQNELVKPDGSRVVIDSVRTHTNVLAIAPDGRVLGTAADEFSLAGDLPMTPFAWDEATGITEFALPPGMIYAWAPYGARDGGYVGFATNGSFDEAYAAVWWNTDGTVASTFDLDLIDATGLNWFTPVGALGDGSLVGYQANTVVTISPGGDVSMVPLAPATEVIIEDVNADGYMVGLAMNANDPEDYFRWVVWGPDGRSIGLDQFLPEGSGRSVGRAIGINDFGDVLVETYIDHMGATRQTYLITGVPAPATGVMVGIAAVMFLPRRRSFTRAA